MRWVNRDDSIAYRMAVTIKDLYAQVGGKRAAGKREPEDASAQNHVGMLRGGNKSKVNQFALLRSSERQLDRRLQHCLRLLWIDSLVDPRGPVAGNVQALDR